MVVGDQLSEQLERYLQLLGVLGVVYEEQQRADTAERLNGVDQRERLVHVRPLDQQIDVRSAHCTQKGKRREREKREERREKREERREKREER